MKNRSAFTLLACATILVGGVYAVAQSSTTSSNSQTSSGNATASSSGRASASSGGSQGGSFGGSFGGGQSGSGMGTGSGSGSGSSGQMSVSGPVWVVTWERDELGRNVRQVDKAVSDHSLWVKENYHRRGVMMEGAFENGDGRMALVYGLEENALWIAQESPLAKSGIAKYKVRKWNVEHSVLSLNTQPGRVAPAAGAGRAVGGGN